MRIGNIQIKNRIQITPHSQHYFKDGLPTDTLINYYVERAKGGVGLLEVSQIYIKLPFGIFYPDWVYDNSKTWPMVNRPEIIPGLRKLADAVHEFGSKIFMEVSAWTYLFGPVSSVPFESGIQLKELTLSDIGEIQEGFGRASKYVKDGHFDGVDLHGTHGALIEHFYSPAFNRRNDKYGGSLENRLRFLFETIETIKGEIGDSLALGMRLCADETIEGGVTPDYASKIAELLDAKLDFINVDNGSTTEFEVLDQNALQTRPLYHGVGYGTYMSEPIKRAVKATKIGIVGRILDPFLADSIIEKGQADYVGMTRALIADPNLPVKAREGRLDEIRPCIGTLQDCWGRSAAHDWPMRCTVNPAVGREGERGTQKIEPAAAKKKVLIIGAGPAGLEAARVAGQRGHEVVIYEKESAIGGQVNLAKLLPGRADIGAIINWYQNQLKLFRVRIEYNKEVPQVAEVVKFLLDEEKPDAVVLATGSRPLDNGIQMLTFREIPGWNKPNVHTIDDVLLRRADIRGRVLVADSTTFVEGPGICEWVARNGATSVTLVTPHAQMSPELVDYNQSVQVSRRLFEHHVRVITYSWIKRINDKTAVIYHIPTGTQDEIEAEIIILHTGRSQNNSVGKLFSGLVKEIYEIGDCDIAGEKIGAAIDSGFKVGSMI